MDEHSLHDSPWILTLRAARQREGFGCPLHYFHRTESTNDVARQLGLDGATEGTIVIAETQTRGRGRLTRRWISPPHRNLYLSLVVRPAIDAGRAPQLALVAGLATVEAVRRWAPAAAIKWPNDVVIDGRKVAGVLAEMETRQGRVDFVVIGIGVNLNSVADDFPPELRDTAVGLCTAAGAAIDRAAFADALLSCLEARHGDYVRGGLAAIGAAWEARSCTTGRHIQIDAGDRQYAGTALGLAADGSLRVRLADGSEMQVVAGDVTVLDGYGSTR